MIYGDIDYNIISSREQHTERRHENMMMNHFTAADLDKMQADRLREAERQLREATTEEQKKRIQARIWRIKNS